MESEARLFDSIFNPRSVAIIGASAQDLATLAQMSTKIRDRLFLVNPKYTEVRGKKCYPSLSAIEAGIDYAMLMGQGVGAHMKALIDLMMEGCEHARDKERKPVLICVSLDSYLEDEEDRHYNLLIKRAFSEKKFPVYPNLDAAVKTLSHLYHFGQRRLSSPFLS